MVHGIGSGLHRGRAGRFFVFVAAGLKTPETLHGGGLLGELRLRREQAEHLRQPLHGLGLSARLAGVAHDAAEVMEAGFYFVEVGLEDAFPM